MELEVRTGILAISALGVYYAIHRSASVARKRATVDLVMNQNSDEYMRDVTAKVRDIIKDDDIEKYTSKELSHSEEAKALRTFLNNYEFIATGIKEGAFDYRLYHRMQFSVVVRDYDALSAFIHTVRKKNSHPTLYQEFEWLAHKFGKNPLKNHSRIKPLSC